MSHFYVYYMTLSLHALFTLTLFHSLYVQGVFFVSLKGNTYEKLMILYMVLFRLGFVLEKSIESLLCSLFVFYSLIQYCIAIMDTEMFT